MPSSRSASTTRQERARVRAYLAGLPPGPRRALKQLRQVVRAAAPGAVEGMGYGILVLRLHGRPVVWYAGWKEHTSLYPIGAAVRRAHAAELKAFKTAKGTIRFPHDRPIPAAFLKRLMRTRLAEVRAAAMG